LFPEEIISVSPGHLFNICQGVTQYTKLRQTTYPVLRQTTYPGFRQIVKAPPSLEDIVFSLSFLLKRPNQIDLQI